MEGINPFMNTIKIDQVTPGANGVTIMGSVTFSNFGESVVSFTRPNDSTPYSAGDVVGDTGGALVRVFSNVQNAIAVTGRQTTLRRAGLEIDQVAPVPVGTGVYLLHLYDALPTGIVDNAPYDLIPADRGKYQGYITILQPIGLTSTLYAQSDQGLTLRLAPGASNLWGILETVNAYTPSPNVVHVITIYPNDL